MFVNESTKTAVNFLSSDIVKVLLIISQNHWKYAGKLTFFENT